VRAALLDPEEGEVPPAVGAQPLVVELGGEAQRAVQVRLGAADVAGGRLQPAGEQQCLGRRAGAPRWLAWLGAAAAALIATGVLIPAGVDAASLTNFAGYVLWCGWLLCLSAVLWTAGGSRARIAASRPGR
jgi:hypothetical protein